jgi:hypothetical protein
MTPPTARSCNGTSMQNTLNVHSRRRTTHSHQRMLNTRCTTLSAAACSGAPTGITLLAGSSLSAAVACTWCHCHFCQACAAAGHAAWFILVRTYIVLLPVACFHSPCRARRGGQHWPMPADCCSAAGTTAERARCQHAEPLS